jgi:hypothetical protein
MLYSRQNAYLILQVLLQPLIQVDLLYDLAGHPFVLFLLALIQHLSFFFSESCKHYLSKLSVS